MTAWLLVGVTLLLVGVVWILALTHTIVLPVVTAGLAAAVAAPLVRWLQRHHVPRGLGAVLIMVSILALGAGVVFVVLAGITSQSGDISSHLTDAKNTIEGWLKDLGVDPKQANDAKKAASSSASATVSSLLDGVASGVKKLSSLAFFLALTALSLIFLLKDGPMIRAWGERHVGAAATGGADHHRAGSPVAAWLLLRRDHRGGFQRGGRGWWGGPAGNPARRDHRGHHLLRCVCALPWARGAPERLQC